MRTKQQIVERLLNPVETDFFGFTVDALARFLTFDEAKPLLTEKATAADWPAPKPLTRDGVIGEMLEYMDFAWDKVQDHRGLSAERSIIKMRAWLWLLGDDELAAMDDYAMYGAPILAAICQKYGFPIPEGEPVARMIAGQCCVPACEEGCGR